MVERSPQTSARHWMGWGVEWGPQAMSVCVSVPGSKVPMYMEGGKLVVSVPGSKVPTYMEGGKLVVSIPGLPCYLWFAVHSVC